MINRFVLACCAALAALTMALPARAQTAPIKWTFETTTKSRYLLGDAGKIAYGGPGQTMSLTAAFPNKCFANLWAWRAFSDDRPGVYAEVDYTVGCGVSLGEYTLNASLSYYDFSTLFKSKNDVVQPIVGLSRSFGFGFHTVTPYFNVKPIMPVDHRATMMAEVGVNDTVKLAERLSVIVGGRALYDEGAFGTASGWNLRGDLTAIVHLRQDLDWKLGVVTTTPLSRFPFGDGRRNTETIGWTGFTARF